LYKIPAVDGLTTRKFYSNDSNDILPIHYYEDTIYSLIHPRKLDDEMSEMCVDNTQESVSFRQFATESPSSSEVNISKVLIRGVITTIADRVGAEVNRDRGDTRVYMRHESDDLKIQGKWATQQLDTGEVRHRSVTVFSKILQ